MALENAVGEVMCQSGRGTGAGCDDGISHVNSEMAGILLNGWLLQRGCYLTDYPPAFSNSRCSIPVCLPPSGNPKHTKKTLGSLAHCTPCCRVSGHCALHAEAFLWIQQNTCLRNFFLGPPINTDRQLDAQARAGLTSGLPDWLLVVFHTTLLYLIVISRATAIPLKMASGIPRSALPLPASKMANGLHEMTESQSNVRAGSGIPTTNSLKHKPTSCMSTLPLSTSPTLLRSCSLALLPPAP
jgi:hypothetical protein